MYYQQGDVLLKSISELPEGNEIKARDGLFVLAEGEATGHKHAIEDIGGIKFIERNGAFYIQNATSVIIKHEEHNSIFLPIGIWKVSKVREYDHFTEEARNVQD